MSIFDETEDKDAEEPQEEDVLRDVIVDQAKDIMILKNLTRNMIKTIKMAGSHSGSLVLFIGRAIKKYPDLQATDEFNAIPKDLKEVLDVAGASVDLLALNKLARLKTEKGGGGSENIQ